ncbi:hypothetical protein SELMODRAFT_446491 [Selaginella moellendorffii]|uniref:Uncharacterized protein n=1 Tax=Selaginella moellendorffii TaxID=88036 RepID=D8SRW9_SELML|nr:uncharacterized protein LOC9639781 [Selaginella moellendorffii]EFJ12863.1 hypothetical protein SELMODRAFT_446491 [Selaginella moellendorffii]|eukprot:XP_002986044.1 uncharacterized protein LOC9639781 [Selaginella moellendorffii]
MHDSRFVIPAPVKQQQPRRSNPAQHQLHQHQLQPQPDLPMSSERLRAMRASAFRAVCRGPSSAAGQNASAASAPAKMTCLCAPTSHPGSFRCRMHRAQQLQQQHHSPPPPHLPPQASSTATAASSTSGARSKFSGGAAPRPAQISSTLKTCSRCRVRGPSRLSTVVFASGREQEETSEEPEIATIPIPLPVVRLSHHATIHRGISAATIGARFCALRRLQGSGKEDFLRLIRPTNPRPILLST